MARPILPVQFRPRPVRGEGRDMNARRHHESPRCPEEDGAGFCSWSRSARARRATVAIAGVVRRVNAKLHGRCSRSRTSRASRRPAPCLTTATGDIKGDGIAFIDTFPTPYPTPQSRSPVSAGTMIITTKRGRAHLTCPGSRSSTRPAPTTLRRPASSPAAPASTRARPAGHPGVQASRLRGEPRRARYIGSWNGPERQAAADTRAEGVDLAPLRNPNQEDTYGVRQPHR
jgi:hypothetical protein